MSQMPPPPPPPPSTPPPPPTGYGSVPFGGGYATAPQYANFGQRLGASLLDGLLYFAAGALGMVPGLVLIFASFSNCDRVDQGDGTTSIQCAPGQLKAGLLLLGIALMAAGFLVAFILQIRHLATSGQTWGRRIVGIKVVGADSGAPIGYGRAFGRLLGGMVSSWVCYLGYLWMLWDGNKQTWHDKMVGSIVVEA